MKSQLPLSESNQSFNRRQIIRALFYGASAATLAACGATNQFRSSDSDSSSNDSGDIIAPTIATEFPIPAGPLANIGQLTADGNIDGILIPEGFSIRRVATSLQPNDQQQFGYAWHIFPDGGAVFPASDPNNPDGWVYVSNSEISNRDIPFPNLLPEVLNLLNIKLYGGVGALEFDRNGALIGMRRICDRTHRNCAGGPTPWQSWLTCEEVVDGIVYECDPMGTPNSQRGLPALGVFNHEAVAVDLHTQTLYLTEDADDGRFYRFLSDGLVPSHFNAEKDALDLENGRLQVLEIEGFENGAYLEDLNQARLIKRVRWVDIIQPERPQNEVRKEFNGHAPGTRFKGGEGIWHHQLSQPLTLAGIDNPMRAVIYFACKGDNRIYAFDIDNDLIEVVFDNTNVAQFKSDNSFIPFNDVDNVVVSPAGDVIVAEDGDEMRLMVMVPNGNPKILLKIPGIGSELTGPAFTPDGSRLYFSSQRALVPLLGGPSILPTGITYELTIPPEYRRPN